LCAATATESVASKEVEKTILRGCCFPIISMEMSPSGKFLAVVHKYRWCICINI
jgi:hypothetical protein